MSARAGPASVRMRAITRRPDADDDRLAGALAAAERGGSADGRSRPRRPRAARARTRGAAGTAPASAPGAPAGAAIARAIHRRRRR